MGASDTQDVRAAAQSVMARCDQLASCTEESGRITRRFATPAMRAANELVADWMSMAGVRVRQGKAGQLIGRYEGSASSAQTVLFGSHPPSVRDAGRYHGALWG